MRLFLQDVRDIRFWVWPKKKRAYPLRPQVDPYCSGIPTRERSHPPWVTDQWERDSSDSRDMDDVRQVPFDHLITMTKAFYQLGKCERKFAALSSGTVKVRIALLQYLHELSPAIG